MAVSAEPIDPKTIKERLKLVPNIEKTPEQTTFLTEVFLLFLSFLLSFF